MGDVVERDRSIKYRNVVKLALSADPSKDFAENAIRVFAVNTRPGKQSDVDLPYLTRSRSR